MKIVKTKKAPEALGHYEQAVIHNGLVYVSGQLPINPENQQVPESIVEQTQQVLENLREVLLAGNADLHTVLNVTLYITDINDWPSINETYAKIFKDHKPARAAVPIVTLPKNSNIEVSCIAHQLPSE